MTQSTHYLAWRIGEARQGRRGRDGAVVEIWRVSQISFRVIACSEAPAGLAKPKVVAGIRHAVRVIDRHMTLVQFPIVGITILQAVRIESTEGIMGEEERPAIWHAQRQFNVVIGLTIEKTWARCEAVVIDHGIDGVARRGSR